MATTLNTCPCPHVTAEQVLEELIADENARVRVGHRPTTRRTIYVSTTGNINVTGYARSAEHGPVYCTLQVLEWEDPELYAKLQAVLDHASAFGGRYLGDPPPEPQRGTTINREPSMSNEPSSPPLNKCGHSEERSKPLVTLMLRLLRPRQRRRCNRPCRPIRQSP
jgi:hypothetical protein